MMLEIKGLSAPVIVVTIVTFSITPEDDNMSRG